MPLQVNSPTSPNVVIYPLGLLDHFWGANMTKGWIVEGILDIEKIRVALDKVVAKWPLLAGRVRPSPNSTKGQARFEIHIPLQRSPSNQPPYNLTSADSPLPISHFVEIPIPAFSDCLPSRLFVPEQRMALGGLTGYAKEDAPLTHWHIAYFRHPGEEYSCLGVNYSHSIFDGIGFAMVMHALEAELKGESWEVPPMPEPGVNQNPFTTHMEAELAKDVRHKRDPFLQISTGGHFTMASYTLRSWWHNTLYGIRHCNLVIPYAVHTGLAKEARKSLEEAGVVDVRPTSGDVLGAWLMQTMYSDGTSPNRTVTIHNVASLRGEWGGQFNLYPHNCWAIVPAPIFTVCEVTVRPLHDIAYQLAKARAVPLAPSGMGFYEKFKEVEKRGGSWNVEHEQADEALHISNVSVARVVDLDWRGAGGGRVLCQYKFFPASSSRLRSTNTVGINGRLDNGDLVVNCLVNARRARRLEDELVKVIARFST
ncbi:hypothetical protein CC1G_07664 [Coprinopsis cinerea okayama7|uniref:Uncharacterized protein n=1 Tax=Coprinopsis cinerea (strain Okayama-7 / 130 / ATCC MYA-4618 / FGSC 9003) TaxID=240176 RepID=A8NC60_COPC7|nr:hypothetical protein CC1G_07664 [Coprinopsis cinerea okayama7\|eukprot:XP_001832404.2 hypothetical protein CC1G_07664 [Coprinopsis cinerea okayama7\